MEDIYGLSDNQIRKSIGEKLKALRLKQNVTQQALAKSADLSLSSVKKIESGEIGTFESFLRVVRILGCLDRLEGLVEEEQMSPSEYYAFRNSLVKSRRRAASRVKKQ